MARQSGVTASVPVLLTRPMAEAQAFGLKLTHGLGARVRPVLAPLMAVEHLAPSLPDGSFSDVIFTSAAGVDAALWLRRVLPRNAWCVGQKTAARATAAGFLARSADGDASALVGAILADPPQGRLLHLRGEETRGDVAERLISAGIETKSLVLYRQKSLPLSTEGARLLATEGNLILPLFSPGSAARFLAAMPADTKATLRLVAMSAAVAETARAIPHQGVITALQPTAEAMLQACAQTLDALPPP